MANFLLVHGAWHGAWCWRRVLPGLVQAGHRVHAVTLTGVGERAHLLHPGIDLETHITDVTMAMDAEEMDDVILVVHSYAGMLGTAVADRRGDLAMAKGRQDWQPLASLLAQDHVMNLRDANGRTLLFHAVINADLEAIRFLCGCLDSPYLGWKDVYGNSVFRYTTRIPDVETGAAICEELRAYRRRTRWQHKRWRTTRVHDEFAWSEPGWRE